MITLEDFWNSSITPVYDDDTKDYISSDEMLKHKDAEVTEFYADGYRTFVTYEKG